MKTISIFGSTGTIGRKAVELASINNFDIIAITGNQNHAELINQARLYNPKYVCVQDGYPFNIVKDALSNLKHIEIIPISKIDEVSKIDVDILIMAISGTAGISPCFAAFGHAKRIAIATKEVIVAAGSFFKKFAEHYGTEVIPVDSEHNAIFQCIQGEESFNINKLILTASGGAFKNLEEKDLEKINLKDALRHPTWNMGIKITVDSATLINKALEIIEAAYLFDIPIERIEPLMHPESIIHGLVYFIDGTFKSIMSSPDMKLSISFAMNYPNRKPCFMEEIDFIKMGFLSFQPLKNWQKRNINLAYKAFTEKKVIAFNIADEIAVQKFVKNEIKFLDIYNFITIVMDKAPKENISSCDDIFEITKNVYEIASKVTL